MMTTETISLVVDGTERSATLIYIDRHGHGISGGTSALAYLHRVRQLPSRDWRDVAGQYESQVLPRAIALLATELKGRRFDAAFRPPSSRDDALPYLTVLLDSLAIARDWSACFNRQDDVKAGIVRSCEALYHAMTFTAPPDLSTARSILMVDDSFTDGTTVCAVWRHLLEAGLSLDCSVTIAVPLRIIPTPAPPAT
jgi:hypothetical protein